MMTLKMRSTKLTACKLKLKKITVHVTPETVQRLLELKLIEVVPEKIGHFKSTAEDLVVWKELRQ